MISNSKCTFCCLYNKTPFIKNTYGSIVYEVIYMPQLASTLLVADGARKGLNISCDIWVYRQPELRVGPTPVEVR